VVRRRAKIVATLGPASSSRSAVNRLFKAGVDVVRLNLSHGTADEHWRLIATVREQAAELGRELPILLDLMGPRYRLGQLEPGGRTLRRGQQVTLGIEGQGVDLPVDDPQLLAHLADGERLLIDNGLVELRIVGRRRKAVLARVVSGGTVATRKGINVPDSRMPFAISDKDRRDVELAVEAQVDYLAASYVGRGADVRAVRRQIRRAGGNQLIVAKLERARAVDHIDEITAAADALMVARGDLGVEVPLHRVPVLQKKMIDAGRRFGKPVIVATQMLESMMEHHRPTRAESSDVANAVFDGADALMLSGETAVGRHPAATVRTMRRIIREAEAFAAERRGSGTAAARDPFQPLEPGAISREGDAEGSALEVANLVAAAAVFSTHRMPVRQLIAFSQGGFTARMISRYRPSVPVLVFTTDPAVARRVQLFWGVRSLVMSDDVAHHDEVVEVVDRHLLESRRAKPGDCVLVLMGDPIRERPLTNLLRVHLVRPATGVLHTQTVEAEPDR
jgi:pyruvate kinase